MDEVMQAKVSTIENCLSWIKDQQRSGDWQADTLVKSELLLNLEKACQASIECAGQIIVQKKFVVPKQPKEAFSMLETLGAIPGDTVNHLKKMLVMRGLIAHDQNIKPAMLESIIINEVAALEVFCRAVKRL